jgi:hypothetical protein
VIQDWLPEAWPPEVLAAVANFRQGDLLVRPPVFYGAVPRYGVARLTTEQGDVDQADEIFEHGDRPAYGMITTETCDISEGESQTPKQPFILISPVYDMSGRLTDDMRSNIQADRVGYLRRLTSEELPAGFWVADLRLEIPLEKSFLVDRAPLAGFTTETDRLALADFLAARRDRPVLSNELHAALVRPLRRWLEKPVSRREQLLAGVAEVRLMISGPRSDPDGAGLIIISDREDVPQSVRDLWDARWENLRGRMDAAGMSLIGNGYETYDTLTARQYVESVSVDLTF